MRRLVFLILVLSLLVTLTFAQKGNIPVVKASSSVYPEDLVLTENNVTTLEGRFDINGSIIVEDNATLILQDAFLNFTQTEDRQHNITLRNPSNGNPRLLAYNSTITSNFKIYTYLLDNSTATINNTTFQSVNEPVWRPTILTYDHSSLSVSNRSYVGDLIVWDFSFVHIHDSKIFYVSHYDSAEAQIYDSEIRSFHVCPRCVNCTISCLKPGLVGYWSFVTNASVNVLVGGSTPSVTLTNTIVNWWGFGFYGDSTFAVVNSAIGDAVMLDNSAAYLESTFCEMATAGYSSTLFITDSIINQRLTAYGSSKTFLLNTTYPAQACYVSGDAKIYLNWCLDVHVVDSIGQDVPSANVTVTYPNTTVAESKLTDTEGWARLTLMEKMMNRTGEYPVGNYTVHATYDIHSDETSVNMTENKEITLTLEGFIIPEFPLFFILPIFMIITLLAVIVCRRKYSM